MAAEAPTIAVTRCGVWAVVVCTEHGAVSSWDNAAYAGLDALGHAAHHHHPVPPPEARCWYCTTPAAGYVTADGGGMVAVCTHHRG